MSLDVFNNRASTTVSSGGTTAPAAGTVETWTVASSAKFPNGASSGATPPTQFRVTDPADATGEIMLVTNQSGTGSNTWTVTRGVEGTTPVAHASGFVAQGIITVAGLDNRYAYMGSALFESFVRANTLDQLAAAAANVSMGGFNLVNLLAGINPTDAANISQLPGVTTILNQTATTTTTSTATLSTLTGAGSVAVAALPTGLAAINYAQVPTNTGGTAIISFTGASAGNLTGVSYVTGSATSGTAIASGTVTFGYMPTVTGTYLVRCIGAGGGGGGGGTSTSAVLQNGGGGGAAGASVDRLVTLTANTFYAAVTAAGGAGAAGGAVGGNSGGNGVYGLPSTFSSGTTGCAAVGGGGGSGGAANAVGTALGGSTNSYNACSAAGGVTGAASLYFTDRLFDGCGGFAFQFGAVVAASLGGAPRGGAAAGGGCGGHATATLGGSAGSPGTYYVGGSGGTNGGNTLAAGLSASNAASTDYGAGGGGGGAGSFSSGGAARGAGGNGGNGGPGVIFVIGPLV